MHGGLEIYTDDFWTDYLIPCFYIDAYYSRNLDMFPTLGIPYDKADPKQITKQIFDFAKKIISEESEYTKFSEQYKKFSEAPILNVPIINVFLQKSIESKTNSIKLNPAIFYTNSHVFDTPEKKKEHQEKNKDCFCNLCLREVV